MPKVIITMTVKEKVSTLTKIVEEKIIIRRFNRVFNNAIPKIEKRFRDLVGLAIVKTPEYFSLLGGGSPSLKEEFGLPDAQQRINSIIAAWLKNIEVDKIDFQKIGTKISGRVKFSIVRKDLSEVGNLGSFITPENGHKLDWLRWLMKEGDKRVIQQYDISPGRGRAGGFIMKRIGSWGVPSQFSGTDISNFVTRSVRNMDPQVFKIVKEEFNRAL